ncbi:MAG: aldo/keto reductase [Verrucomicrobia bacterium]|nr:aldo/keto reductase [Verrucomicrobiota bacterium]
MGTGFLGGRNPSGDPSELDEELGVETVIEAIEAGCSLIDTAPIYGQTKSEVMIGKALRARPDLREGLIVTTKVGQTVEGRDYSYDAIMRNVEASQQRLGMESFEILYVHDAINVPMENVLGKGGTLEALRKLQDDGVVRFIGTAANDPDTNGPFIETGEFDVAVVADAWSLLNQQAQHLIFPAAKKYNVGIALATPHERGLLATGPKANNRYLNRRFSSEIIAHVGKLQNLCVEFDIPLVAVSLQWCLRHPMISTVIPGVANPAEARQNIEVGSMEIPESFWQELEPLINDWTESRYVVEIKNKFK